MSTNDLSTRPSRRELLALGVGAFVVASMPLAARGRQRGRVRRTLPVMGTIADLTVVAEDPRAGQAALDAAMAELRFVDRTMTFFDPTSDIGRANRFAMREGVAIDPATARVVAEALRWAAASDGGFDPCLGRATALWDVRHRHVPPSAAAVRRVAGEGRWRALDLDTFQGRPAVRFGDEGIALDLGGIAKGYGVDRAVAALREHGIEQALVNVGGDLYALGRSEDGDAWKIGIRSPHSPAALAGTLRVEDEAIATSGDYLACFDHAGHHYHHLLDPETGAPRAPHGFHSVTVAAPTCLAADAGATAAFGLDASRAAAVLGRAAVGARVVNRA